MANGDDRGAAHGEGDEPSAPRSERGAHLAAPDADAAADTTARSWLRRVVAFYVEGFRSMDVGRTLWVVVLLKVAVLTLIATLLLPSLRRHEPANEREQTEQVLDRLTQEVSK